MDLSVTPKAAIRLAIMEAKLRHSPDDYVNGLEHALECISDMARILRHVRSKVPSREPELLALITNQLVKGCDLE
jgi:hypothetical protein